MKIELCQSIFITLHFMSQLLGNIVIPAVPFLGTPAQLLRGPGAVSFSKQWHQRIRDRISKGKCGSKRDVSRPFISTQTHVFSEPRGET